MKRQITSISMRTSFNGDDTKYKIGGTVAANLEVKQIEYRQIGLAGINSRAPEESHYLVQLINILNKEEMVFKIIPTKEVQEITFIEIREEAEDDITIERVS